MNVVLFYDGDCPLCDKEIKVLKMLNRRNKVDFVNIANAQFDPKVYNKTIDDFMREIHAKTKDNSLVTGMDAFRAVYDELGLKWLSRLTQIPGIRSALDLGYRIFARNRLRVTGRSAYSCRADGCEVKSLEK
jgi:predicted DCC family thiol-disulfide oxidoreductase YuxK